MSTQFISSFLKMHPLNYYVLVTFNYSSGLIEKISLHEIKFFNNLSLLMEHVKSQCWLLKEPIEIKQEKILEILEIIKNYLIGKKVNLFDEIKRINVDLSLEHKFPTLFSRKVINSLLKYKYGEFTSYSQLGEDMDSKAYRAIGSVLKKNPLPLIIPCHRVVNKNGKIGGFMGFTNKGWQLDIKSHLINLETS